MKMCTERLQILATQRNNMIVNGWYHCPAGHKTGQRVEKKSNIENTPIWCKHCKKAYYPVIKDGKISNEKRG